MTKDAPRLKNITQWKRNHRTRFYHVRSYTLDMDTAKMTRLWEAAAVVDDFGNLVIIELEIVTHNLK